MRKSFLAVAALILLAGYALAAKEHSLQELMEQADAAQSEQRVSLSVEVARRQLQTADDLYKTTNLEGARLALSDVVKYSQNARDAASESGKKLKDTEIAFRKMAAKLRDIQRTLNLEDQDPVDDAVDKLEHMRTDLLALMFSKKSK